MAAGHSGQFTPMRLPVNTVIHTTLVGLEPATFRSLVRRATSSATEPHRSIQCSSVSKILVRTRCEILRQIATSAAITISNGEKRSAVRFEPISYEQQAITGELTTFTCSFRASCLQVCGSRRHASFPNKRRLHHDLQWRPLPNSS